MPIDYNNKKIIPNPSDEDTRMHVAMDRIIARLPTLEGEGGKVLVVSPDEEHCEWTPVAGVTHDYRDLTYKPKINHVELYGDKSLTDLGIQQEIDKKQNKVYYQETQPTTAVAGDLWCTNGGSESVAFADITGSPLDNLNLKLELEKKVDKVIPTSPFAMGRDTGGLFYQYTV